MREQDLNGDGAFQVPVFRAIRFSDPTRAKQGKYCSTLLGETH
jgi:hypothetical protein